MHRIVPSLLFALLTLSGCFAEHGTAHLRLGDECDPDIEDCGPADSGRAEPNACQEMHARAIGECDYEIGWAFNGANCAALNGCECVGDECDSLFPDAASCQARYSMCAPPAACSLRCAPDTYPAGDECLPRPTSCIGEVTDPVCGCDGVTYRAPCLAHTAGIEVLSHGECTAPTACTLRCDPDMYPAGGECLPRPSVCTEEWDPVCGCDGTTYGNECEAQAAGIEIVDGDACPAAPVCSLACAPDEYAEGGECLARPSTCTDEWDPVCGCDGETYGNTCEAHAAGMEISERGECPAAAACSLVCAPDTYPEGGDCFPRPDRCTDEWDPVCGCDGETYGNTCEAHAAGVEVLQRGECEVPAPVACSLRCDPDQYPEGGDCHPLPGGCTDEWMPVCGCDGVTYSSACEAHAAGVEVTDDDACARR